jgi:hypothetical protein
LLKAPCQEFLGRVFRFFGGGRGFAVNRKSILELQPKRGQQIDVNDCRQTIVAGWLRVELCPISLFGNPMNLSFYTLSAICACWVFFLAWVNAQYAMQLGGGTDFVKLEQPFSDFTYVVTVKAWVNFGGASGAPSLGQSKSVRLVWQIGDTAKPEFRIKQVGGYNSGISLPGIQTLTRCDNIASVADANSLSNYCNGFLITNSPAGIILCKTASSALGELNVGGLQDIVLGDGDT